jgi:excisionase family DNA binding protein
VYHLYPPESREDLLMPKRIQSVPESKQAKVFISVAEGAALIGVSKPTVWRAIRLKKIRRYKVGTRTVIKPEDVLSIVQEA